MCYRRLLTIFLIMPLFLRTASKGANSKASLEGLSKTAAPNALPNAEFKTLSADAPNPIPYPFVASIQMVENGKYKHLCGGVILDNEFVLTAAHCNLKPRQLFAKDLLVGAGSNLLFDTKAQRFQVRSIKKHPEFKPLYGHDILLLQLATPIPIDNIRFAAIDFRNSTSRKDGNLNSMLLGWGRTTPNMPKQLEVVPFRTISDEMCFLKYKFKYLTRSEICAVNTDGPRGACDGDSGGPLVDAMQHTVYGLLSYGRKPCETGKPFAFTRISIYVNWIEEQMRSMRKLNNMNALR
ncbi:mast cell protease 1A isoform X1 [Drosophila montana]|uniref:mast cell protease 1A isoform X1 n=2 Tax=Drosophila montana TaxID=40370 RepID=UPI00313C1D42